MRIGRFLLLLAVLLLLIAVPVRAEDEISEAETQDADVYIDEIVVTGSRITRKNMISASPLTQLDSEELVTRGVTRVEDALNTLPQVFPDQTAYIANGSLGIATLNLRGLGANRSLVLLNGRRLAGSTDTDLNQIPGALIDRVEVLTGGASAAYGSDALTGVANFITKENFQGFEFDYLYSLYQHDNEHATARDALSDAGYEPPAHSVTDGDTHEFSLLWGYGDGKRGNISAYATYRHIEAVTQSDRDYSACALWYDDLGQWECRGSATIPEGYFTDWGLLARPPADASGNPLPPWDTQPWPGSFEFNVEPGTDQFEDWSDDPIYYNYAPLNYYQRPDERITLGTLGHYTLSDKFEMYFEVHFMDYESDSQIAESGSFGYGFSVNCSNPLMSAQQFDLLCGRYNLTTSDSQMVFIGRRNVEGGPRDYVFEHQATRWVVGARGAINDQWSYDVFANYGESEYSDTFFKELSVSRMHRALDVVADPITGDAVCVSVLDGTDPDCVPWNIFESGAVTQPMLDYIDLAGAFPETQERLQVTGYVSGDLTDYGLTLPTADDGVRVVLGIEYRDEELNFSPNEAAQSGDFAGTGTEYKPVYGGFDLREVFAETMVPIVQGKNWAELVSIELGYRYSDYSTGATANTYKIAGEWAINPSIRLRASLQHAIRAGDILELFDPTATSFAWSVDSCVGQSPVSTLEECQNTGLTAAQYGTLFDLHDDGVEPVNTINGGNPDLDPEESDTLSYGVVWTPTFIPSLSMSIDYFDIDLEKAIETGNARAIFDVCLDTGLAEFCDKINRDPATGSLGIGDAHILSTDTNIAFLQTSGVDVIADYVFGIGRAGNIGLSLKLTYLDELKYQEHVVADVVDCVGTLKLFCGEPSYQWAGILRTVWTTPWDASISLNWRHMDKVRDEWSAEYPLDIKRMNYFDLAAVWDISDAVTVRLGVNNLLDEDPPLRPFGPIPPFNGNTFPGSYDPLGRYWFTGVSLRL